jgi:putative endonuclease
MFHYVYALQSKTDDSIYVGYTANLRQRLMEHNAGKNVSTKRARPWVLIFYEAYRTESDARRREKYLKTNQGARFLKRMNKDYLYQSSKHSSRISTSRWTG